MNNVRAELSSMFGKIMAGTVTREEGSMLISDLVRKDQASTMMALKNLIENPPPGVFPKTILHTLVLTRNKVFYSILVACLGSKNEDLSILAAHELANLRTNESLDVLVEHIDSEAYHVRKASANAIVKGFAAQGIEILAAHVKNHPEPFFRATSTNALLSAGRGGITALLGLLGSGPTAAICSAAEALCKVSGSLEPGDADTVVGALMAAGDRNDTQAAMELLRLVGAMGDKAGRYSEYVRAFTDHQSDGVRREAEAALRAVAGTGSNEFGA